MKEEDIAAAFEFFGHKNRKLNKTNVIETFNKLCKNVSKKDIHTIFGDKDEVTFQDVKELLENNTVVMDPVIAAFRILDPTNCGYITEDRLKKIFANLGYCELDDEELKVLIQKGDSDGDGKINLEDFRNLSGLNIVKHTTEPRKDRNIPDVEKLKRFQKEKNQKILTNKRF